MKVRWTPTAILVAALLALVGCGGGGSLVGFEDASVTIAFDAPSGMDATDDLGIHDGASDLVETSEQPTTNCVDRDNDRYGFGLGCINVDCDDDNASVTDQCYCGRLPNTRAGCECRLGDQPRPCDVDNDLTYSATETCNVGQRTCDPVPGSPETGRWSECRRWRPDYPTPTRFIGVVSQCPGNCSPQCRHQVICPEAADAIPAGSTDIAAANAAHAVFCPGGAGLRGGITSTCTSTSGGNYTRGTSPLSWRDACAAPGRQTVLMNSDDGTTQLPLPFTFRFYGAPYVTAGIATNGMISFVDPTYWWVNSSLPTADVANTIFAFWDDVYNRSRGECIAVYGSSPNREYVVQWSDQYFYPPDGAGNTTEHMTYQVVLAETTNTIDVLYNQMEGQGDRATGNSATIGIQQGTGSSFDLVGNNSAGVAPAMRTIRWTPSSGSTVCATGTYRRIYEGTTCDGIDAPYWGQFNFSSIVPQGTSIEFRVRVAQTSAGLTSATWTRLPNAPNGTPTMPSTLDVGAAIRAAMPTAVGADHFPFLELQARLIPSPDRTLAPTLISTEVQFTCAPTEDVSCRMGAACFIASDPCRRGVINCLNSAGGRPVEVCVDVGAQPPGTVCGVGAVCNASGVCVPCNEGMVCSTGQACTTGRISCATGAPLCTIATQLPVGTVCGGDTSVYTRSRPSPMPWVDVCGITGHQTFLANSDDGIDGESLPFTFRFYGSPYSYVGLASNGTFSFVMPTYQWINSTLPTTAVENSIFGFWDDIYQRNGICTATIGSTPLRRYIAEWEDNFFYPPGSSNASEHITFEMSLSEGSNAIDVIYSRMEGQGDRATGNSATVGIQRHSGSTFDLVGLDTAGITSAGSSIRWLPGSSSVCNATADCVPCANGAPCSLPGICVIGVLDCSSGSPVCTNAGTRPPAAETCNGVDDDCDGVIDNGLSQGCYAGPSGTSGVGVCSAGVQICSAGAWGACVGQVVPGMETCDGVDEDCDGVINNGNPGGGVACSTGEQGRCSAGTTACTAGAIVCNRDNGPISETCNGVDDDCDGTVDEGLGTTSCGIGPCMRTVPACVGGVPQICVPGGSGTEVCDGLDNDCDGLIDEGFCRIGGLCFTNGQVNPASSCQVCTVPSSSVSGPTAWSNVAAGTVCRGAAGVCDVAESCDGTGAACPPDGFVPLATGGYSRTTSPLGFIDACGASGATVLWPGSSVDDASQSVPIPFSFSFYGGLFSSGWVNSNGTFSFSSGSAAYGHTPLPNGALPNTIFPHWDDLYLRATGNACVATVGMAPNRQFVVQWRDASFCCSDDPTAHLNFEVVLSEGSNTVDVIYGSMGPSTRATGGNATIGIQNADGSVFDQVAYNDAAAATTGRSYRWAPSSGTVCRPSAGVCDVAESCTGLSAGCPTDGFLPPGTECRASTSMTTCDPAEACTGSSAMCPADVITRVPSAERCNGIDDDCNGGVDEPFLSNSFQITSLGSTGCARIEHNFVTGDDRGGIAVSTASVFYTGDSATGRFALDLSSPMSTGFQYDALTSNLRTGQVYSLGTGPTPIPNSGGTVTTLIALDGTTGVPTGAVVTLSTSITVAYGTGIFAGWDRVVLHTGSNVYSIALPSGAVTDLGVVSAPPHSGCENWAYWGVAEYFGGQLYIDYVRDSSAIERMAVPSGVRTVLATFSSLSDMCSFTVSPSTSRWYWHHEGGSQFGGSDESIGYCTAAFMAGGGGGPGTGLGDSCTAGVGVCLNTGTVVCNVAGTGTTCSVTSGTGTGEVCDGLDNDCDGLIDEGFCRIGGLCFTNGQVNPASSCQVCTVPSSSVSGPTAWSNVAAGTVCRGAAGVCDVAESCDGTGAACPPDGFVPLATGGYSRTTSPLGFIDACGASGATVLWPGSSVDDASQSVPIPFSFSFYGGLFSSGWVNSNGTFSFSSGSAAYGHTPLPNGALPNTIFPHWDDLYLRATGNACVATVGMAPNRQFVVQWRDASFCCSDDPTAHLNFEVVLSEGSNTVDVIYGSMGPSTRATGGNATIGIQNADGSVFDQVAYNDAAAATTGRSYRWAPSSGTVCRPSAGVCDVAESCTGLSAGCPTDGFLPPGTECRASTSMTTCDPAEACTGSSAMCPADVITRVPSAERCNGIDDDCNGGVDEPFLSNSFQITSLGSTGCARIEHNFVTGDDRGGIAVSTASVFYTGDSATGRFALDLSSPMSTGFQYDALTSNLRTGQVYSLGTGPTPIPNSGGTVTTLIALDGTTGVPTGAVVTLSTSITVAYGTGIFAGWDRVVLHTGSNVYSIALPSGAVTDLGVVSAPPHSGCENWAYWGVAEYFGGQLYIDYVRDSSAIERMAVPSGVRTVLATFSSLSDMCSFTVSPSTSRWYWHHEGGSQFGGSDESIGYCTAAFMAGGGGGPGTGLGDSCTAGVGVCLNTGTVVCNVAGTGTTCSVTSGTGTGEVCDGLDNDCNGSVDDGNPGAGATCTVTGQLGLCATGQTWCGNGPLSSDGRVRNWLTLGTFANPLCGVTTTSDINESAARPVAGQSESGQTWSEWRYDLGACQACGVGINLDCRFAGPTGDLSNVSAYLFAYVYSPTTQAVQLRTGSDDGIRAWLNGALVLDGSGSCRGCAEDQDVTPVPLLAGVNRLLLKIGEAGGGWGAMARFTDLSGSPLALGFTTTPTGAASACRQSTFATTEVCDGQDNDCDGLIDEGFCRIGGVCFTNGQTNPANNCQVCTVGSVTVSGPTSWSNVTAGTVCRPVSGMCDVAETCNGSGSACPADGFTASGTVCRAVADLCDVAESCTGSSAACPANGFTAAGTVCRGSMGVCDVAESCTGSSAACPANGFTAAGTVCRGSMGVCDVAEACTGVSAACPNDAFVASSTVCRSAVPGGCDVAENCTGSAAACPADAVSATGTVCRSVAGLCDVAETCNGSNTCPADGFLSSATVCRPSSSIAACDPAESCTGSSALCPTNVITRVPTTELCDAVDNDCDGVVDDPWIRPTGCVPGVEVCDRVDNDCDGLVDEGLAGSLACPGRSCEDIYAATMSIGSGYYWLNPTSASTAGRFEAWCDMVADGSGWTLVGRSRPGGWGPGCAGGDGGSSFGWRSAQGAVRNDAAAYSLNAFGVGLPVTQMLFGSYAGGKSWGANVFRHTVPSNFVAAWGGSEFFNGTPATVSGPCSPGMFGWIGFTSATDQFHLRDVPGGSFGLTASGWASCYDASCYAGNINGSQGQIMARAPAISYGYLTGTCTVGVGACARVGALMCTADGRGTACSVSAGSPGAEVCDGLDNDCNGLVDEGYCRIGGTCFTTGQLNPANNCQVCVVPSTTVSGPTSWSNVPSGTVCRASMGVCDVQETCNGSGAACPADGFLSSATVCRASTSIAACDPAESCTGSSALCPPNVITRVPTAETCNGVDDNCNGATDEPFSVRPVSCSTVNRGSPSGVYEIDPDGAGAIAPFAAYCDMTTNGGGWTLALKADGRAATFIYDAAYWTNTVLLNPGSTNNEFREAKLASFTGTSFNELMAGFSANGYHRNIVLSVLPQSSLQTLFASGTVSVGPGRAGWLAAIQNSSLQLNCNLQGININPVPAVSQRVRVGILGNNENDCASADSRLGIGGYGSNCATLLNQSVGSTARCGGSNGNEDVTTFGYLQVRDTAAAINSWFGGALSSSCSVGVGACARTGTFTCRSDNNGTACSAVVGSPVTETCNGIDDDCNGVVDDIAATSCTLGACSTAELRCPLTTAGTTVAAACVRTGYLAAGASCRPAVAGGCDVAEVCAGLTDACPADVVVPAGTVCRPVAAGGCDVAESCNGTNACPVDAFQPATFVCRASTSIAACDPAERCPGGSALCPPDTVIRAPMTETCNGADDDCDGQTDETYTPLPVSCASVNRSSPTGVYQIDPDGAGVLPSFAAYCDMTTSGGGWTLALKADGRNATFVYDAAYWTNGTLLTTASTNNSYQEAKFNSFTATRFNQIIAGMSGNGYDRNVVMTLASTYTSLSTLFMGGQVATGLGRSAWLNLIPNSTLQPNCNLEGININPNPAVSERVRVGILGNNEADCATADSRLGIGGYGDDCGTALNQSSGNTTRCGGTNGDADVTTFGYLQVRDSAATINAWPGGALSTACSVGVGACARAGTFMCRLDGTGTNCNVSAGPAATETCNGIDDDCNGVVDDIAATSCTLGACATGQLRCPLTTAGTTVAAACVRTGYVAAGTMCRPAVAGGCDVAESCTGTADACPADVVATVGTVCRPLAVGMACDAVETCNGASNTCPADAFQPAGTMCRAAVAGVCDVAEVCAGGTAACPADAVVPAGTPSAFTNTGAEGAFAPVTNTVLTPGVHNFTTITIPAGVTVTTNGTGILDLRATGAVTINGVINLSGAAGGNGSNGGVGCYQGGGNGGATGVPSAAGATGVASCTVGGTSGTGATGGTGNNYSCVGGSGGGGTSGGGTFGGGGGGGVAAAGGGGGGYAGGGGGGGYIHTGGSGGSFNGSTGGSGGVGNGGRCGGGTGGVAPAPYAGGTGGTGVCGGATGGGGGGGSIGATAAADLAVTSTFHPGSGGGGAGGNNQRCSYGGAGGGGGGGALRIVSPLAITVGVTGQLLANGGNGGSTPTADGSGGGGGGSGGVILLESPSLTVAGAVRAAGGAGGSSNVGCGADGGVGGLGRIRLSTGSTCTLSGTFNPPLASGCAAGGTSGQANVTRTLGTTCRPSLSVLACDPPETCNGTSNVCPTNVVTRVPTPETCNGVDDNCDGVVDNITATACSPGACATGHQACSGTSVVCVVDSYSPNGTLCRASVNACDPAETCTGSSTNCPTNVSAPAGFSDCSGVCLPTGTACTVGAGNCAASGTMTCGVSGPINVSVGYLFSCGLNRDGSVRCWGYNGNGESGNASYTAYQVTPNTVGGGLANVTEIEGGHHHTCARVNGGTVRCWGYNGYGQLGDGTLNSTAIPTTVSGLTNVTRISSGIWHSCAMRGDGSVWCWGYGGNGQLGNGTYPGNQTTPVRVSGISNAVDISCGGYHCCAALADGTANCWGWNGYGQLGNGAPGADLATPTTVVGLTGVTKVSASYWNSCAIVAGGAVRCWGYGANGELGNGAYSSIYTPVGVVGVSGATLIDSGYHHTCVRLSDSTSRCWGYNGHGQLGNGTFTSSPVPVSQGLGGVIEVTSSVYHTCAALTDGTVRCWGFNDYYQLGNGTTGNQPSPVNVNAFSAGTTCSATAGAPGAQACTGDGNCNGVVGDITPGNCQYNECVGGALYCSGASTACTYGYYYGYGTACTSLSGGICNGGGSCVCPSGTAYCTGACRAVQTYYYDNDLDGYGTPYSTTTGCPGAPPFHYVTNNTDCNDSNAAIYPGRAEACNGLDDNCNGSIDEGNPGGGASCSTGNVCIAGAMTCVGGSLSCQVSGYNNGTACTPAGSPATVTYIRGTSPLPWIDACTNGARTNYSLGDDGATGSVGIGFGFNYYGTTYTTVGINSNGWLSFPSASSGLWSNYALPYSGISNGIFAFWDDLYPYSGTVCTVTVGSAPNRRFITQWNNYSFLGDPSSALTFQISLTESTNTIDVLYHSMYSSTSGRASGGSATIGIQNGTGPTVDHVSTNTPMSVGPSGSLRWSPTTSGTPTGVCASGTCVGSGVLRFTLGWAHPSDFDLHVVTPCGSHIYFGSLTPGGSCGGTQDHDDTVGIGPENTFWTSAATTGSYTVCVVPWSQRYGGYNAFSVGAYVSNTLTGGYRNGSYYYSDSTTDCSRYSAYYVGTFYYNGTSSSYWY